MLWTSIRIDKPTADWLEEYRKNLGAAVASGRIPHPVSDRKDRVSLGHAIVQLLTNQRRHGQRAKRHAAKDRKLRKERIAARDTADIASCYPPV